METVTTTEAALPGLEPPPATTSPKPGHWLERGPQKRLMVFSGSSHPELAQNIAEKLGVELGEVTLKTFAPNRGAMAFWEGLGFTPRVVQLTSATSSLEDRLDER